MTGREHLEGQYIYRRIILVLKRILKETGCCSLDRISLARDMDQRRALVNAVMNF
jgi:hypothetical protein